MRGNAKFMTFVIAATVAVVPYFAAAQQQPPDTSTFSITVPDPVSNFVQNLGNIDLGNIPIVQDISRIANSNAGNASSMDLSNVGGLWNSLNTWFGEHVGISFSSIVQTIGNAMLWVLDLMGRLLKAGLSYLPGN